MRMELLSSLGAGKISTMPSVPSPSPKPVVASWSGGKDSSLMLERLIADPAVQVSCLLTVITTEYDRISIHGVRRSILNQQAEALGIPLVEVPIAASASNADYERAMTVALAGIRKADPAVETIAFGDLFLEDVRTYRNALLDRLGWSGLYPLWGEDTSHLADYFVAADYAAILSCVDTTQLDASFAGRNFDTDLLMDLPAAVDRCGERGEFHTCVYAGPILREKLSLKAGERTLRDGRFMYCDILDDSEIGMHNRRMVNLSGDRGTAVNTWPD